MVWPITGANLTWVKRASQSKRWGCWWLNRSVVDKSPLHSSCPGPRVLSVIAWFRQLSRVAFNGIAAEASEATKFMHDRKKRRSNERHQIWMLVVAHRGGHEGLVYIIGDGISPRNQENSKPSNGESSRPENAVHNGVLESNLEFQQ